MNNKLLAWIVSGVVLAAIVAAFFAVGSPAKQRLVRFDERRVADLQNIQSRIITYWQQKATLPNQLADLQDDISGFKVPTDPETGQVYEYDVEADLTFELCANFNLASSGQEKNVPSPAYPEFGLDPYSQNWAHGEGRECFTRTIDPELYKPVNRLD
jgi:hypothetical protein